MALSLVERWQQTADVEVFYDLSSRKLIYKKYTWVYCQSVDTRQCGRYVDLQTLNAKFLGAAMSQDERHLAFHRTQSEVEVVALSTMETCNVRVAKQKNIIGYHWLPLSLLSDFFLVTSGGVDFLKLQESPLKLITVKSYTFSTSQYWFDAVTGTLVLSHNAKKTGTMRAYHCYQGKTSKFDGQKFKLTASLPASNTWASSHPGCLGLISYQSAPTPHKCMLGKLYETIYFLHLHTVSGLLQLYSITPDSISLLPICINRVPDDYNLFLLDNLIVLQSISRREEYYYDIKAQNCANGPFATVLHPETGLESVGRKGSEGEKSFTLRKDFIRVDQDVLIDAKEGRCYRMELQATELVPQECPLTSSLLFLLRRNGCKFAAFEHLRRELFNQVPLQSVSEFFMTISKMYRQVALERQSAPPRRQASCVVDVQMSLAVEPDLRSDWTTVMLQSEMQTLVLQELCESPHLPSSYATSIILEYQRSLIAQEIHVNLSVQLLLIRQLIRTENFILLQTLLQFRVLMDSKETAALLISLGDDTYRPALQLAVDMLLRLKDYAELSRLLIQKGLVYEAIMSLDMDTLPTDVFHPIESLLLSLPDTEQSLLVRSYISRRKSSL